MTVVPGEWEVSSTRVRELLATGGDVSGMLMPETEWYIRERGLYGARA
jgi:nicotinic acid mononucleotide adenylyltransferase